MEISLTSWRRVVSFGYLVPVRGLGPGGTDSHMRVRIMAKKKRAGKPVNLPVTWDGDRMGHVAVRTLHMKDQKTDWSVYCCLGHSAWLVGKAVANETDAIFGSVWQGCYTLAMLFDGTVRPTGRITADGHTTPGVPLPNECTSAALYNQLMILIQEGVHLDNHCFTIVMKPDYKKPEVTHDYDRMKVQPSFNPEPAPM